MPKRYIQRVRSWMRVLYTGVHGSASDFMKCSELTVKEMKGSADEVGTACALLPSVFCDSLI